MTSVCMRYVGAMEASSYLSLYADKLLKGENQSNAEVLDCIRMFANSRCDFIVLVISLTLGTANYRMEFKKRKTICRFFFWRAHRPALVVYLRDNEAKIARIPQCRALGTCLHGIYYH